MKNGKYLDSLSSDKKSRILKNIASHYGLSVADAEDEVRDEDAEMLYEYIANDKALRMEVYNDMERGKMAKGGQMKQSTFKYHKVPNQNLWAIQECDLNGENCGVIRTKKSEMEAKKEVARLNKQGYCEYSMAKGGKTKKAKEPMVVRSYFEDEAIDYGQGGRMKKFSSGGLTGENARVKKLTDEYASESLRDEFTEKSNIKNENIADNYVIAFAYTDYGGDFFDKVAIAYFEENYPNNIVVENSGYGGQNALVWGKPAEEFIEQTEDYPLGFEDIESYYYEKQNEAEYESFEYYLEDLSRDYTFDKSEVLDWLMENRSGYYNMTTQGLDFSYEDLTDKLESEGLIEKENMAKGGLLGGFNYSIGGL
jgi:hypothetical protein